MITCLILLNWNFSSPAQTYDFIPSNELIKNKTNFYQYYWSNPDSALIYAREIAKDSSNMLFLREVLHDDTFLYFHDRVRNYMMEKSQTINSDPEGSHLDNDYEGLLNIQYETISKLASDTNQLLSNSVDPLFSWIHIKQNLNDFEKSKKLIRIFSDKVDNSDDLYFNNAATYALFIYEEICTVPELSVLADSLILNTVKKLESLQLEDKPLFGDPNLPSSAKENAYFYKRAYYRYTFSTACQIIAEKLQKQEKNSEAIYYFKKAFEYSPDLRDIIYEGVYAEEKLVFHTLKNGGEESLKNNYLQKIENKDSLLNILSIAATVDPVKYKDFLREYYVLSNDEEDFVDFWEQKINSGIKDAPNLTFFLEDGIDSNNKWLLIEFWGSWCGPCRITHPALQKFYETVQTDYSQKFEIFTVACHDSREKVDIYMDKYDYSFPVLLSDDKIEKSFQVLGFPSTFLVTPQGKSFIIPTLGHEWVEYVKKYASLE